MKREKLEARRKMLINKLEDLKNKLSAERMEISRKYDMQGWGYAMRHVKIGVSTRKEDLIKCRIKIVEKEISALDKELNIGEYEN